MTTYTGTTHGDTFATPILAGDTVDGLAGDDTITLVDLSSQTVAVNFDAVAAATATGAAPVTGMLIKNVEHITTLKTGTGDDTYALVMSHNNPFTWFAGTGTDRLNLNFATESSDITVSHSGSDYLITGGSVVHNVELLTITAGSGDDIFENITSGDVVEGGAGNDTIDLVFTGSAAITYNAKSASTSTGVTLSDGTTVKHVEHLRSLITGLGNDTLTISATQGAFEWHANAGTDKLVADYSTVSADINAYVTGGEYYIDTFSSHAFDIERVMITGGSGDDSLSGTNGNDTLNGGAGDDVLDGLKGVSLIDGGADNDTVSLDLSAVNTAIAYSGIDAATATGTTLSDGSSVKNTEHLAALSTGNGDDTLTILATQGKFIWNAGDGNDRLIIDFTGVSANINAYVNTNYFYMDTYSSYAYDIESVSFTGGSGNDTVTGTAHNDTLNGAAGNDVLDAGAGIATIDGGAGSDTLSMDLSATSLDINFDGVTAIGATGIALADGSTIKNIEKIGTLSTGNGNDTLTVLGSAGNFQWNAGDGNDRLVIDFTGTATAVHSYQNTNYYYTDLHGSYAYDIESVSVTGGSGNDTLGGTAGDDTLNGGAGNDYLDGLAGINQIDGGAGSDTVSLDLSTSTADINFNAITATQAAGITLSDGSSIKNVEHIGALSTGSGNDTLTISLAQAQFTWYAGDGNDHLDVDYHTATSGINAYVNGTDYFYIDTFGSYAYAIESVTMTGGSGNDTLTGTTGNDWFEGNGGNDDLDGGDGIDTAAYTRASSAVTVSLATGAVQNTGGAGNDSLINFENLLGSAFNDHLTGNSLANALDGGVGADILAGGAGDDSYYVDNAGDVTTEAAGQGTDTVFASLTWTAGDNIENVTLTGIRNNNATGNGLANTLTGNVGNNILDGGTGDDIMIGGAGNDSYYVDTAGDIVTEGLNAGTDTVFTGLDYILGANVERLGLTGKASVSGTGNELANSLTGNTGDNHLYGQAGNDSILGGEGDDVLDGGKGADIMKGGVGNDVYYVDNGEDAITESSSQGTDTVFSSVNYTLTANVENLLLTGFALNGTGNASANSITGNAYKNVLAGGDGNDIIDGGIGADTMSGGNGNDTYYVENVHDVVSELAAQGTDLVYSSISFSLATAGDTENLTLTGNADLTGTGNALNNIIIANSGSDHLYGGDGNDTLQGGIGNDTIDGGIGADTMKGGVGNDIYYVDNVGDVVTENVGEGTDTVNASVGFTLDHNTENLSLTGTANINGSGNALDNLLIGNSGNNNLFGSSGADTLMGGDGNDTLDGGTGTDTMIGGNGNDAYVCTSTTDVVTENANAGHDIVYAGISWTLGANFEDLDFSGGGNYSGTGNSLDNFITGNVGNNVFNGMAGNDWIDGYWGNDTYIGGTGADTFNFSQGTGHDADVINDFSLSDGDIIRVHDALSFGTDLIITQVGADVKLDFGDGDYVLVLNATDNATFESHIAYL